MLNSEWPSDNQPTQNNPDQPFRTHPIVNRKSKIVNRKAIPNAPNRKS